MNIQRLIHVSELLPNDEVIISSNSYLKYLKVLQPVKFRGLNWNDKPTYKNVKCSFIKTGTYESMNRYFEQNCEKHNKINYVDLNYRSIFLVKREE